MQWNDDANQRRRLPRNDDNSGGGGGDGDDEDASKKLIARVLQSSPAKHDSAVLAAAAAADGTAGLGGARAACLPRAAGPCKPPRWRPTTGHVPCSSRPPTSSLGLPSST